MRILITGGSGYIGSLVMKKLSQQSDVQEIINVDLRLTQQQLPKVKTIRRDISQDVCDLFGSDEAAIDIAIHAAWTVTPLRDSSEQRRICIGGTQRFLDGCLAGGVKHILFVSSATAYGAHPEHDQLCNELTPLRSEYHFQYSSEKRESEALFQRYANDHPDILLQVVRPVVVAGPNVSNYIFRTITKPVLFMAHGHDPQMQLVHEEDVARAIVAILLSRVPGSFNLAANGSVRLGQMYQRLGARRIVQLPLPVLLAITDWGWKNGFRAITEAPAGMVYFITYPWLVSNQRVQKEVGFRFRYTTEQVLDAYISTRLQQKQP